MALTGIARFAGRLRGYLKHVGEKIATVTLGAMFVSPLGQILRRVMGRVGSQRPVPSIQIAMIAHVYYPELLPEVLACRAVIPCSIDLHITTTEDRAQYVRSALAGQKAVAVHVLPNRGRDIAPFLAVLSAGALDGYDAVLKLHTKSSPHLLDGALRRRLLFQTLCGAPQSVLRILSLFLDPATAMVGWGICFRSTSRHWFANEMSVRELAARMGAAESVRPGFFEGSMFWFRPSAFERLRALNLTAEDFEEEASQVDGTMHHAIERCFTIAVWASGYVVRDLHGRLLPRE
jgi:lipopolysaccharide biosynthesis protein